MNEHYLAMRGLAALRDAMVLQLFLTVGIVLGSIGLLRLANGSRLVAILCDVQLGLVLWAWTVMLLILGTHQ